jgi:hypothetical protein
MCLHCSLRLLSETHFAAINIVWVTFEMRAERQSFRHFCPNCTQMGMYPQILVKVPVIKFNENLFSCSRIR